jgi:hypothetical protein
MGLFKKDNDSPSNFNRGPNKKDAQGFARKLLALLSGKRVDTWRGEDSHWELIFGFGFFFGGLYFLFSFLGGS